MAIAIKNIKRCICSYVHNFNTVYYFQVGQLLQRIRIELANLLEEKMQDPLLNLLNHQAGKQIIRTIVNVITKT